MRQLSGHLPAGHLRSSAAIRDRSTMGNDGVPCETWLTPEMTIGSRCIPPVLRRAHAIQAGIGTAGGTDPAAWRGEALGRLGDRATS
jgi:hypothetical protein